MQSQAPATSLLIDETLKGKITETLLPGEEILWAGRPVYGSFRQDQKVLLPLGLLLLIISGMILVSAINTSSPVIFLIGIVFILLGVVAWRSPGQKRRLYDKTAYVITNQRAFMVGPDQSTFYRIELLQHARREHFSDDTGNLIFEHYYEQDSENGSHLISLGFNDLPNIQEAEKQLVEVISKHHFQGKFTKLIKRLNPPIINPVESDITSAVISLNSDKDYLMVTRSDDSIIWVMKDGSDYFVEYFNPVNACIYKSENTCWKDDRVVSTILEFINQKDQWKRSYSWALSNLATTRPKEIKTDDHSRIWFGLVAALAIFIGLWLFIDDLRFQKRANETQGRVVSLQFDGEVYFRVVQFEGSGGKTYKKKMGWADSNPSYQVGDIVTVLYDPDDLNDPPRAKMKGAGIMTKISIMIGSVLFVAYYVILIFVKSPFQLKVRKRIALDSPFLNIPNQPS